MKLYYKTFPLKLWRNFYHSKVSLGDFFFGAMTGPFVWPVRSFLLGTGPFVWPVRSFWLGTGPLFKGPVIDRFLDRSMTVSLVKRTVIDRYFEPVDDRSFY